MEPLSLSAMPTNFRYEGDLIFESNDKIFAGGDKPIRIWVNGDVVIPAGMIIDASGTISGAFAGRRGAGGGTAGAPRSGGSGGSGGRGILGAALVAVVVVVVLDRDQTVAVLVEAAVLQLLSGVLDRLETPGQLEPQGAQASPIPRPVVQEEVQAQEGRLLAQAVFAVVVLVVVLGP